MNTTLWRYSFVEHLSIRLDFHFDFMRCAALLWIFSPYVCIGLAASMCVYIGVLNFLALPSMLNHITSHRTIISLIIKSILASHFYCHQYIHKPKYSFIRSFARSQTGKQTNNIHVDDNNQVCNSTATNKWISPYHSKWIFVLFIALIDRLEPNTRNARIRNSPTKLSDPFERKKNSIFFLTKMKHLTCFQVENFKWKNQFAQRM